MKILSQMCQQESVACGIELLIHPPHKADLLLLYTFLDFQEIRHRVTFIFHLVFYP